MSFLTRTKQLKTIAGIGLVVYGVLGPSALSLYAGVALIGWGLLRGASMWRHTEGVDQQTSSNNVIGESPRPRLGGPNR